MTMVVGGPFVVSTVVPETPEETFERNQARRNEASRTPFDFLGKGLINPFRRGSRDFVSAERVELVRSSVRQILGTRAAIGDDIVGELAWRPDFGSKFWQLKHRNNDGTLKGLAIAYAYEALAWEPRIEVVGVTTEPDVNAPNRLSIRVTYRIIDQNVAGNRVFLPEQFEEVVSLTG